jgi:hypothetical protein
VVGGGIGVALPPIGWLGFTVAASLLGLAVALILWTEYRGKRPPAAPAPVPPDARTTPLGPSWS